MVHKMRDLDQGYDYEVLDKKTQMLRKHEFFRHSETKVKRSRSCCWPIVVILVLLWVLFFLLWLYSRIKGLESFSVTNVNIYYPAKLVRIPAVLANKNGAYCLDGTVPSYYFRKGKGKGKKSWMVHLAGGGWCWDLPGCYLRSFSNLGSSDAKYLPERFELNGALSDKQNVNPDFYNWNVAYVNYCDGASFSGNVPYPIAYKNQTLFFRGALVLDVVINYLVQSAGMKDADKIILTGVSAGGVAVVLHIDHIKSLIPDGIPFHGFVDAGIFLDTTNMTNFDQFRVCSQRVYNIQQVWGSLNEDCVKAQSQNTRWKCFFTEYAYEYVQTPIFYVNSVYDYWGLWFILEMYCHPTQCPEQISFFNNFHKQYINVVTEMRKKVSNISGGMFISSCYAHSQTMVDTIYTSYRVAGKTVQEAVGDWYFSRAPGGKSFYFDCEDPYDCNPTCDWSLEYYEKKTSNMNKTTRKCVL